MIIMAAVRLRASAESDLKSAIALRRTYESLKSKAQPTFGKGTPSAKKKFADWKASHPNYPTTQLKVLEKQLRNLKEKADPGLKKSRKETEQADKARRVKLDQLNRQLDRVLDLIYEQKHSPDHDFSDDEDDGVEGYLARLRRQANDLRKEIKKLG